MSAVTIAGPEGLSPVMERALKYWELEEADEWLHTPQKLLSDRTPWSLIVAGKTDEIHALFDQIDAGVYL